MYDQGDAEGAVSPVIGVQNLLMRPLPRGGAAAIRVPTIQHALGAGSQASETGQTLL
jgi:hypothetical protein